MSKDISRYVLVKLTDFYEVATDYLLERTETKHHSNAVLADLRLNDDRIDLLKNGRIDTAMFCRPATHKDLMKLLTDIQIHEKTA